MRYPLHVCALLLAFAGIIVTSIYDDVIYPMDDGLISIGMVLLFVALLQTLIRRVTRDEQRARKAKREVRRTPTPGS